MRSNSLTAHTRMLERLRVLTSTDARISMGPPVPGVWVPAFMKLPRTGNGPTRVPAAQSYSMADPAAAMVMRICWPP